MTAGCSSAPAVRRLFAGETFDVSEHRCPGWPARCPEERVTADEIVLPRRGAWIRRSSSGTVFADPAAALFFNAGEFYEIRHPLREPDASTVFTLKPRLADELRRRRGECTAFGSGATAMSDQAACSHRVFLAALEFRDPTDPLMLEEAGINLLQLVSAEASHHPPGTGSSPRTRREVAHAAAAFLNRSFCDRILLSDVAAAAGCSVFHLCRVFRAEMGHTINEHLTRLRLRAALDPILASARAVTDVAHELGFSSHSHFTAAFRRRFGMTPTELRARERSRTLGAQTSRPDLTGPREIAAPGLHSADPACGPAT